MEASIDLHVHPFLGENSLIDIVEAMNKADLDVAALESLDCSLYPLVLSEAAKFYPNPVADEAGLKLPDGKYLLNGREYNTKEGFHILTVGYSVDEATPQTEIREIIDKGLKYDALVILDHPFVDNGKTKTAGHISEEMEYGLEQLCKEYPGRIALEWNSYCIPWVRRFLKTVLNSAGHRTLYSDVNRKVEDLSEKLKKEGCNLPVITDTDLHARSKRHLSAIGTARFITNIEGECASDIVRSVKKNIFDGDYENVKNYAGFFHLLDAFCLPILFPMLFKKPRA